MSILNALATDFLGKTTTRPTNSLPFCEMSGCWTWEDLLCIIGGLNTFISDPLRGFRDHRWKQDENNVLKGFHEFRLRHVFNIGIEREGFVGMSDHCLQIRSFPAQWFDGFSDLKVMIVWIHSELLIKPTCHQTYLTSFIFLITVQFEPILDPLECEWSSVECIEVGRRVFDVFDDEHHQRILYEAGNRSSHLGKERHTLPDTKSDHTSEPIFDWDGRWKWSLLFQLAIRCRHLLLHAHVDHCRQIDIPVEHSHSSL